MMYEIGSTQQKRTFKIRCKKMLSTQTGRTAS